MTQTPALPGLRAADKQLVGSGVGRRSWRESSGGPGGRGEGCDLPAAAVAGHRALAGGEHDVLAAHESPDAVGGSDAGGEVVVGGVEVAGDQPLVGDDEND